MHKLLQRQLKHHLSAATIDALPKEWKRLFEAVSQAYSQADEDRLLLERSLELTSQELIQRNNALWADITHRKEIETWLSGQKRILEMVAKGMDLGEILEVICRVVEERSPDMLCSICLLDSEGKHLELGAGPSLPASYTQLTRRIQIGPNMGSCGSAAYEGKAVVVTDIATDPKWDAFREAALAHNLRACWSTPIFSTKEKVLGTFAMYYREARHPTPEAGQLIDMATYLAGIAIERQQAEESLKERATELMRSNTELEQFAYVASHDLQEPLRMVASYTQLLARRYKGKLGADADDFIHFAVDGVTRMQALINDLLAYSRVGTRAKPFEQTDCASILKQALDNLQLAIKDADAVVTSDPLPTVQADSLQLLQLFQNLLGNAVKFHGETLPRVHVSVQEEETGWLFSVRDNGIGIPAESKDRVFVIFQRLHNKSEYPGTGIGLAVCKKIVERHGGRIWVESEPEKGSTFFFTLSSHPPMNEGEQANVDSNRNSAR